MPNTPTPNTSNKWIRLLRAIPQMLRLCFTDSRDYVTRLYVRTAWAAKGMSIASTARLHYESPAQIEIKGRCFIGNFSIVIVGASKELIPPPFLIIGDNVYIGDQVNLRADGGIIRIGCDVLVANQVTIVAANHQTRLGKSIVEQNWQRGDVLIEDDVWIGAGVVILPGAIIRQGAIIAAGAVVRGEVPSNTIFGGIPARQIGVRS